jgi:hypothetical protein
VLLVKMLSQTGIPTFVQKRPIEPNEPVQLLDWKDRQ